MVTSMQGKAAEASTRVLADGTTIVEGERGVARMSRVTSGVLLYVCTGQFRTSYAQPMIKVAEHEVRMAGKLLMVTDAWELASVDTGFREAWTEWFKAHKHHFRMELLVRTRLMQMAADLANLFTGLAVVKTYSKVPEWERAVAREVPSFRRSAPVP
jgi:hypothetical protein